MDSASHNTADGTSELKLSDIIGSRFLFLVRLHDLSEATYFRHGIYNMISFRVNSITCIVGFQDQQNTIIRK